MASATAEQVNTADGGESMAETMEDGRMMSSDTLHRLSGLALMVALPLWFVGRVIHPANEELSSLLSPLYPPAHLVMLGAAVFALLGLPGFYARQAHRAGRLGVAGFGLSLVTTAVLCHILLHEAFVAPRLAREAAAQALVAPGGPLAHAAFASMGALYPVLLIGFLASAPLLGLATLRAGVLPRPSGWLLVLCLVPNLLSALPPPAALAALPHWLTSMVAWGEYLLFLGYAWGGYALWTEAVPAAGYSARSVEPSAAA